MWVYLVFNDIKPDLFIVRGNDLPKELKQLQSQNHQIKLKIFSEQDSNQKLFEYFSNIDSHFIMGIGNIVGWGEKFISELKEFKI